ncbi:MAG: HAD-IIB family hydrolase [Nocardioides sp.]|uniref:HAD family hydrolase n=1 Tax=Nocardioides sp. TaxID=35761 RepID=UPI0039E3E495
MSATRPTTGAPLPRLVATDLDGTLVRSDGAVSEYTATVLRRLDELDVPVIFVTGRPLRWTEVVFEHVGSHGLAIVSNGALVWDVAAGLARAERAMAPAETLAVADRLRAACPGTAYATETVAGFGMEPGFMRHVDDDEIPRAPLAELATQPLLKLLALHPELDPDEFLARADRAVGDTVTVTRSSTTALLEISAAGVTKASTLAQVAADLGVAAEEVIAFGDMPNDLPMLTWAGTSYAMADAHPQVTACAGNVAPGHDEDGVARVLAGVFGL